MAYDFKNLCEKTEATLKKLIQEDTEQIEIKADIPDYIEDNSGESECESRQSKKDNYTCKTCDKTVNSKKDLLDHMRKHTNEEIDFSNVNDVQEGIDDTSPNKREFECKFCSKVLTTAVGLKIHTRRHTGLNLHVCNVGVEYLAIFFLFINLLFRFVTNHTQKRATLKGTNLYILKK